MAELLSSFIRRCGSRRCVVLTGAGCSTESGVPDYRGPNGLYRRADFKPLMLQEFLSSELEQKRYWARSMLGYSFVTGASCNAAHMGLHALSRAGVVAHILTQNVDGLHHLAAHGGAGSAEETAYPLYTQSEYNVHELHGNIHQVICMQCKDISPRQRLQRKLREVNEEMCAAHAAEHNMRRPDGDFDAPLSAVRAMRLVSCEACGGSLKPHVVLFGDNVPRRRVEETLSIVREASCLVCLGTSLQVFSAYRYVVAAKESGVPIAIVTNGVTRADGVEDLKIDTPSASNIVQGLSRLLIGGDTM